MDGISVYERSPASKTRHRIPSFISGTTHGTTSPTPTPTLPEDSAVSFGAGSQKMPSRSNPGIIAPQPRQHHLIQASASQDWLHTPPLSPVSSRGVSPALSSHSLSSPRLSGRRMQSFSSIYSQHDVSNFGKSDGRSTRSHEEQVIGMGRRWIRWMDRQGLKPWVIPFAIAFSILVKWSIALGSYSGYATPPMFGDYEAQRHWMEITIHLPPREWYKYDLQYWGLDYPPLTAYVSWMCGIIGHAINPAWFALDKSRGMETPSSKTFMRATVIFFDLIVYVPALVMFARVWQGTRSRRTQNMVLISLLLQPALLLIDFGHFQYNSVMLGFTLLSLNFFAMERDLLGAVCFVLSLGFKQMALYYAPAVGTYLLAKCLYLGPSKGFRLFSNLAIVTTLSFLLLFIPFLPPLSPLHTILDPIKRIFPFSRGLFEDKVANFWCASNVLIKWRSWASSSVLIKLSTFLTALGFLPSVVVLMQTGYALRERALPQTPLLPLLPYALLNSSMSFFLFSFQVHEKTILLPLLPLSLLSSGASPDSTVHAWGALVNNVAMFSMWPLLKKDGMGTQYLAMLLLWNRLLGHNPLKYRSSFVHWLSITTYLAALTLHFLEFIIVPPARYPDLFPVLNVLLSTPIFILIWLWSIQRIVETSWALRGPAPKPVEETPSSKMAHTLASERVRSTRTTSLGFARARQRPLFRERASSTGPDGSVSVLR